MELYQKICPRMNREAFKVGAKLIRRVSYKGIRANRCRKPKSIEEFEDQYVSLYAGVPSR
jgi:hypothetical protein